MTTVHVTHIEDTKKLVESWLAANAHVESISEDGEDGILGMVLRSHLGKLTLRRYSVPLNLDTKSHQSYAILSPKRSPYRVDDSCFGRENPDEVRVQHDRLWHKYFNPDWKRLDFLLGDREEHDGGLGEGLLILFWCIVGLLCAVIAMALGLWVFV